MDRKLIGALLLLLASGGCCSCDSSCDYLPPVLDGPYSSTGMRTGSAKDTNFGIPTPIADEVLTPLPVAE